MLIIDIMIHSIVARLKKGAIQVLSSNAMGGGGGYADQHRSPLRRCVLQHYCGVVEVSNFQKKRYVTLEHFWPQRLESF